MAELGIQSPTKFHKLLAETLNECPNGVAYFDRQSNQLSEKAKGAIGMISDQVFALLQKIHQQQERQRD